MELDRPKEEPIEEFPSKPTELTLGNSVNTKKPRIKGQRKPKQTSSVPRTEIPEGFILKMIITPEEANQIRNRVDKLREDLPFYDPFIHDPDGYELRLD